MTVQEFDQQSNERVEDSGKSELEMYLEEARLDRKSELDVLEYWKKVQHKYPVLSVMVRDIFSIPITTVTSESSFSAGGRIFNCYRNSLLSENFEALLYTRTWLYGFRDDSGKIYITITCHYIFYYYFLLLHFLMLSFCFCRWNQ